MGVADKIPEVIPSAEVFFQSAKNLIVGYPFEQVNIEIQCLFDKIDNGLFF